MTTVTGALAWGTSRQAHHTLKPRPRIRTSCSSISARIATPSGRSNTSTGMASSYHKHLVWFADVATHRSQWSRSRRWIGSARFARNGTRCGFLQSPSPSTCTTWPGRLAGVGFVERSLLAGAWKSRAASAWRSTVKIAVCGRRMVTRLNAIVTGARATSEALPRQWGRRWHQMRNRTWSTSARIAFDAGPYMQKSCLNIKGWHSAHCAVGLAIQRWSRGERVANQSHTIVEKTRRSASTRKKRSASIQTEPERTQARRGRATMSWCSSLPSLRKKIPSRLREPLLDCVQDCQLAHKKPAACDMCL